MFKKFVPRLIAAFITLADTTTFAAANPFSDLPTGHWAYDSVTQLVSDGVIEGYGDGTFLGNRNITRYEMAQMVAKAMAKNPSGADKAALDRLAAEFGEELNNLGVRVSNLEKYADKVKWAGELRYTYTSQRLDGANHNNKKSNNDEMLLRLEPVAEVNNHWTIHTRIDLATNMAKDSTSEAKLQRAWAEGNYNHLNIKVGKYNNLTPYNKNLMFFNQNSGAEVTFGKVIKAQIRVGRINLKNDSRYDDMAERMTGSANLDDETANLQSIALMYTHKKFSSVRALYHLNSSAFKNNYYARGANEDDAWIFESSGTYRFDDNVAVTGAYLKNKKADFYRHSHLIQVDYKGAKVADKGSWGAYAAYRYQSGNVSIDPSCDGAFQNTKGLEISAQYTILPNIQVKAIYFNGEQLENGRDAEKLFGRMEWFF